MGVEFRDREQNPLVVEYFIALAKYYEDHGDAILMYALIS